VRRTRSLNPSAELAWTFPRAYTLTSGIEYAALDQLIAGSVNVKAIEDDWNEVLHLAASIRTGTVSASVMLKKLAGYPRQDSLSRALREIGRVERSLFMLDWLDDIELRRRTNANLNKGEARNALARAVFFNRFGELRDRTFENQRHRASGLNMVSAEIILWNTVYLAEPPITSVSRAGTLMTHYLAMPHHWVGSTSV
jgi:TnpA family transposase